MVEPMARFEHGGDVYTHEGVVDFSANINPLGMPPIAREALVKHVADYERYPDAECRDLRQALARLEGTDAGTIVCTAGASDLLQRLCNVVRPKVALVTAPCFSGYEEALEQAGARIVRHPLREEDGFNVTDSLLGFTQRDYSLGGGAVGSAEAGESAAPAMLFLCTPNNPTGLVIDRDLLVRVLDEAREAGVVVVLDECFLDFTGEPSAVELCVRYPNLVVMRAFTKMYAMAGLRVGYGICADEAFIAQLAHAGQPWAVSGPAQVAALAALSETDWVERTRRYVDEQRAVLVQGLQAAGMQVIPGRANYLLFKSPRELYEPLLRRGFLIRRCGNFQGFDESWYRVAVRTAEENAAFLEVLQVICSC